MTIVPQTVDRDIVAGLNVLREKGRYVSKDSFDWVRLRRLAENLIKSEPALGWADLGMVYSVTGDIAKAEDCFSNAIKLGADSATLLNILISYAGIGLCSAAISLYSEIGSPEQGFFPIALVFGVGRGAFQKSSQFIEKARRMQIDMTGLSVDVVEKSAEVLRRFDLSDDDVARHLDVAGSVLRENKILESHTPTVIVTDVEGEMTGVTMVLYIKCDPSEIFSYNVALAEKEEELNIAKHPAFDVVFSAYEGDE